MTVKNSPQPMHHRSIDNQTWLCDDGAIKIESRLVDTRHVESSVGFGRRLAAGEAVHDMTVRAVVDPTLTIRDIEVDMARTPFDLCPGIISAFEGLKGESMHTGWNALLKQRFSGSGGCRHLVDLLRGMPTVVMQTLYREIDWNEAALAYVTDSCHAFQKEGEVIQWIQEEIAFPKAKAQ